MRFHRFWEDVLSTPERVRMLRLLSLSPPVGFTGRSIAPLVNVSEQGTRKILHQLAAYHLVHAHKAGRADMWDVNERHVLWRLLRAVFEDERTALQRVGREVAKQLPQDRVSRALLFGSVARGDEKPGSDIDVLVVVKRLEDKRKIEDRLHALSLDFLERFGNGISPRVFAHAEYAAELKRSVGLVRAAEKEGIDLLKPEVAH